MVIAVAGEGGLVLDGVAEDYLESVAHSRASVGNATAVASSRLHDAAVLASLAVAQAAWIALAMYVFALAV